MFNFLKKNMRPFLKLFLNFIHEILGFCPPSVALMLWWGIAELMDREKTSSLFYFDTNTHFLLTLSMWTWRHFLCDWTGIHVKKENTSNNKIEPETKQMSQKSFFWTAFQVILWQQTVSFETKFLQSQIWFNLSESSRFSKTSCCLTCREVSPTSCVLPAFSAQSIFSHTSFI